MHRRTAWIISICGILAAILTGCSSDSSTTYPVAPVHGSVTFQGKAVPGGNIRFIPASVEGEGNRPEATGILDEVGSFRLSTYSDSDGAVLGKHRVVFSVPLDAEDASDELEEAKEDGDAEAVAELQAEIELSKKLVEMGLGRVEPDPAEVTVVSGDNTVVIKLVRNNERD